MAHALGCAQGVSLTTARARGQLVFLEGLRSAVDIFLRAEGEAHPLQFLRSVRLQPSPGAQLAGPAQRSCGLPLGSLPLGAREGSAAAGQTRPCCGSITGSPCADPGPEGGRAAVPKAVGSIVCGNLVTGSVSGKWPPRESRGSPGEMGQPLQEQVACYTPAAPRPEPLMQDPKLLFSFLCPVRTCWEGCSRLPSHRSPPGPHLG